VFLFREQKPNGSIRATGRPYPYSLPEEPNPRPYPGFRMPDQPPIWAPDLGGQWFGIPLQAPVGSSDPMTIICPVIVMLSGPNLSRCV
jgi:hypothetical protein